jgi:hypothetical protein
VCDLATKLLIDPFQEHKALALFPVYFGIRLLFTKAVPQPQSQKAIGENKTNRFCYGKAEQSQMSFKLRFADASIHMKKFKLHHWSP